MKRKIYTLQCTSAKQLRRLKLEAPTRSVPILTVDLPWGAH